MAYTERVASFLRGKTYKQCCVQIWFNSMHILYVKNTIQWSFHRVQKFVDGWEVLFVGITFLVCCFICSCGACNVDGTSPGSVECVNMREQVSSNLKPCHEYSMERGVSGGEAQI